LSELRASAKLNVGFYFNSSSSVGLGHFNRCFHLALAFRKQNASVYFHLQDSSVSLLKSHSWCDQQLELFSTSSEKLINSSSIVNFCQKKKIEILIVDDYSFLAEWEDTIRDHVFLVVIDDHLHPHSAHLVLNHRPGLKSRCIESPSGNPQILLGGARFCMTDALKFPERQDHSKLKILLHAGGGDIYESFQSFYVSFIEIAIEELGFSIEILKVDKNKPLPDDLLKFINEGQAKQISFDRPLRDELASYQIVVGPAGTTTYESIIAGCIPYSFEVLDDGRDSSAGWAIIGHLFHLKYSEIEDPSVNKVTKMLLSNPAIPRSYLDRAEEKIDGQGCSRAASEIIYYFNNKKRLTNAFNKRIDLYRYKPGSVNFAECTASDAFEFLDSRNAIGAREVSTKNDHIISRVDHLVWWGNAAIKKYKLYQRLSSDVAAYFWIKKIVLDQKIFYTSGWFPAESFDTGSGLTVGLDVMKTMGQLVADKSDVGLWVISMRPENRFAVKANERFGFTVMNPLIPEIEDLYPGCVEAGLTIMSKGSCS
jgi:spore coat polysaccharide biosynthesis predicted glycosyltransferase SpsG